MVLHHYRTVHCPKCGETADKRETDRTYILYGSPYRVCPHCGAPYFDSGYHELAIDAFNDKGILIDFWQFIGLLVFNGASVEYIASGLIKTAGMWLVLMFLVVPALLVDYKLLLTVRNLLFAKRYHQEQIDWIEGISGEMTEDLEESMARVSDRKYLDALRSHGVDVPEYFYKRVGSRTGSFVEQEGVEVVRMATEQMF